MDSSNAERAHQISRWEGSLFPDLDGEGDDGFRIDVRPWNRAIANRGFPAMSQGYEHAQCWNFPMFPVVLHKTS